MLEHHWFKRISFGTLVLLLAAGSSSGKAKHFGQLFSESGPPRSEAELYGFKGSLLAILYGDSEGRTEHENPVTTGKDGMYWFYADNGRYAIAEKAGSGQFKFFLMASWLAKKCPSLTIQPFAHWEHPSRASAALPLATDH